MEIRKKKVKLWALFSKTLLIFDKLSVKFGHVWSKVYYNFLRFWMRFKEVADDLPNPKLIQKKKTVYVPSPESRQVCTGVSATKYDIKIFQITIEQIKTKLPQENTINNQ